MCVCVCCKLVIWLVRLMTLILVLVAVHLLGLVHGHPGYLDCNGLVTQSKIMGFAVQKGTVNTAPFRVEEADSMSSASEWRNFTISARQGYEIVVQTTDGSNLTSYAPGICGGGRGLGHGLCQTCGLQLFAEDTDCTENVCVFGVHQGYNKNRKVSLLVGASAGSAVTTVAFNF